MRAKMVRARSGWSRRIRTRATWSVEVDIIFVRTYETLAVGEVSIAAVHPVKLQVQPSISNHSAHAPASLLSLLH